MIGDGILMYDRENDMFFAGFTKPHYGEASRPKWTKSAKDARLIGMLSTAYRLRTQLGNDVIIISETRARNIQTMRECKEEAECSRKSQTPQRMREIRNFSPN